MATRCQRFPTPKIKQLSWAALCDLRIFDVSRPASEEVATAVAWPRCHLHRPAASAQKVHLMSTGDAMNTGAVALYVAATLWVPAALAQRRQASMLRTVPAWPPHAMLAEVIQRISARVRAAGSPSPRSQFKSRRMRGAYATGVSEPTPTIGNPRQGWRDRG